MTPILSVINLEKYFGKTIAVDGISFNINAGVCLGLLGPNGAGKTTTIEIIEGILPPTRGEILYKGVPKDRINKLFKAETGIQFQNTLLQEHLTVKENLILFGSFYKNSIPIDEIINLCALQDFLDKDTRKISGGQKQRLLLGLALINDPLLLILDEPTVGLDPQARRNFWDLIQLIKKRKKTIILTTHYMEEANLLCDEIIIIDKGKIISQGSPHTLLKTLDYSHKLSLPKTTFLNYHLDNVSLIETNDRVEILTKNLNHTLTTLIQQKVPLSDLHIKSTNLEDVFLNLTGHQLRE